MINRKYFKLIEKELNFKEITVIIGSRQVGKTTIMQSIYEKVKDNAVFLSFDDVETLNLFENNEKLFKEQYVDSNEIIFIDEIQYSKQSGRILKYLYDSTKKKFFISGSSTPEISINSLSYLVGRIRIIEIYPLLFKEFISYKSKGKEVLFNKKRKFKNFNQISNNFEEYLKFGSYPRIVSLPLNEKENALKVLVNTYLLKEIKEILEYKNLFIFEKFLKYLAINDGGLVNKSSISQDLGISTLKITEMLETLEKTYIIKVVKPFFSNKLKEEIKSSKVYFQDLGFKNSLLNNFNELNLRIEKGSILENFVLNVFIRKGFEIKFWNYKNRHEMDFLVEKNGEIIGFECKSKLKNSKLSTSTKAFIDTIKPAKVYVINETLDLIEKYECVEVEFINYLNLIYIVDKL